MNYTEALRRLKDPVYAFSWQEWLETASLFRTTQGRSGDVLECIAMGNAFQAIDGQVQPSGVHWLSQLYQEESTR